MISLFCSWTASGTCSLRIGFAALFIILSLTGEVRAEYALQSGDVLELNINGFPELTRKLTVDTDGFITPPLIDHTIAAGMTLSDLNKSLKKLYQNRLVRSRTLDGKNFTQLISDEDVNISIFEYRPVYVTGDVAKPGEQKYRPGLTVLQAITMAGGVGEDATADKDRAQLPLIQSNVRSAEAEVLNSSLSIWLYNSELGNTPQVSLENIGSNLDLGQGELAGYRKNASTQLNTKKSEDAREKAFLKMSISQNDARLATLIEQKQKEEEGNKEDSQDYQRVSGLLERGTTNILRVTDARRVVLLSATRVLQTEAAIAQARKERDETKNKLDGYDDKRRIMLLDELQKAREKFEIASAKLKSARRQLEVTRLSRSDILQLPAQDVKKVIVRNSNGGMAKLVVSDEQVVLPGDTIIVTAARPGLMNNYSND